MPKNLFRRITRHFFVGSNWVLAVLFLLGCYGYYFKPVYFWPIGFLTLGTFYLFLALMVFFFFWLVVKPRRCLISLAAVVVALPSLTNVTPLRFSGSFQKIKTDSVFRVMSWNVEHFDILEHKKRPEVKQQMIDLVNDYTPDLACFQEMVGSDTVPGAINYVPSMQAAMNFSGNFYSYNKKIDFDDNHHFGIIIFSKYPIVRTQTVRHFPFDYNSIFQWVDVARGTDTIRVFNLHLQSMRFSPDNIRYIKNPDIQDDKDLKQTRSLIYKLKIGFIKRETQAGRIAAEIAKSPYPVVVCGDFNDVPNSYAYHTIGKGLQNAFEERGAGFGRTFSGISPTLRIDNIFAGNEFEITQFTTIKRKLSDHFALVADLQVQKK